MATVQPDGYSYILMKDVQGEKAPGMFKAVLVGSAPKHVQLLRGELLSSIPQRDRDKVPRNDGRPAHNFRSKKDPNVALYVDDTNVAPAKGRELQLLEAIEKPYDRFTVFSIENRLEWGSSLRKGDQVFVKIPTPNTSVPTWSIGLVRYAGPVEGLPGWNFGVEIKDSHYHERGSTDGVFGEYRYFECDENCGLIVSLEKLAPEPPPSHGAAHSVVQKPRNPPVDSSANPKISSHNFDTPVDQPLQHFKVNDRVVVYNKKNIATHGTVRWIGRHVQTRTLESNHIGIETDTVAVTNDFAKALTGVSQLFRATPGHRLVVPEQFVFREDLANTRKPPAQDFDLSNPAAAARELGMSERQFVAEQKRVLKEAEEKKKKEDKARKAEEKRNKGKNEKTDSELEQVKNAVEETINVTAQKAAIEAFNKEKQEQNKQKKTQREQEQARAQAESEQQGQGGRQQFQKQSSHQPRADHPYESPPGEGSPRPPRDERGGAALHTDIREHEMAHRQNIERGHRQNSYPQGGRLDHDPHRGVGQVSDVQYQVEVQIGANQYGMKREGSQGRLAPLNEAKDKYAHYVNFSPPEDHIPHEQLHPSSQLYNQGQGYGNQAAPSQIYSHGQERYDPHYHNMPQDAYQGHHQYPHEAPPPQANLQPESQYDPRHNQQQTGQGIHHPPQQQPPQFAASVGTTNSFNLVVGSAVQLATTDSTDHPRYGVIKWVGTASGVQGQVAGIELEEYLDGCTDGTLKSTGQKFFNCAPGHGLYFPLASLSPDKRFVDATTQGQGHPGYSENPVSVPMEEEKDQVLHDPTQQIRLYTGNMKGIQGHQNSCYLDSTIFGLFALSDIFDTMFLEPNQAITSVQSRKAVSELLWKGIVNPLRKNGVVRYESVMRMRNALEVLGKMEGITEKEKDPEEFLNMLFKHVLHTKPFISIRRPFGVEKEFFVQLFVEHDPNLKVPTVGELLRRMFKEQQISFKKVPSKLLIQVPRFGREFKTYQKTVPELKINIRELTDSFKNAEVPDCFICGLRSEVKCKDCGTLSGQSHTYYCQRCSKLFHENQAHTERAGHTMADAVDLDGHVGELDLLSVICIETSHYVCFTRDPRDDTERKWIFFDSMADRKYDMYNIPKVTDCTHELNEWVYSGDRTRLMSTQPRQLPELVRRFTQDIYMCVYIQPDVALYGDADDEDDNENEAQNK